MRAQARGAASQVRTRRRGDETEQPIKLRSVVLFVNGARKGKGQRARSPCLLPLIVLLHVCFEKRPNYVQRCP